MSFFQPTLFGVRGGTVQPARTTPEQDETGRDGTGSSLMPIRRQLVATHRATLPQRPMDTDQALLALLRRRSL